MTHLIARELSARANNCLRHIRRLVLLGASANHWDADCLDAFSCGGRQTTCNHLQYYVFAVVFSIK